MTVLSSKQDSDPIQSISRPDRAAEGPERSDDLDDGSVINFVVGIGASAGGLRSLQRLFKSLPVTDEVAYVVVQHISPVAESNMDEILSRYTKMNVSIVEHGMQIQAAHVYLIPPAKEIRLNGNRIEVHDLTRDQIAKPIDTFFESLAESFGGRAIAAILSGTGSDGSQGVRRIRAMGGTTIAESPMSAQFDGMPKAAVATDCIDFSLTPEQIAQWLIRQFSNPDQKPAIESELGEEQLTGIRLIFALLAKRHDIEFSYYKPATVARRIERRQQMRRLDSIFKYADFVEGNVEELDFLYHDLLIGVTKFFRDTEAFAKLSKHVKDAVAKQPAHEEFRVWVAGCATGEEAYSIAVVCDEAFKAVDRKPNYKIFATDVHGGALEGAARGVYSSDSMEYVGQQRRSRYFIQESDNSFRVSADLRRHMVFARHNVVQDPPFTRMNLLTCRNLLIYLNNEAQFKAVSAFHFSLKIGGMMMMGASETPGKFLTEFEVADETWKLFTKIRNLPVNAAENNDILAVPMTRPRRLVNLLNSDRPETLSFTSLVEGYDLILKEYVSSGVMLNDKRSVMHIFGNANRYLKSNSGRFSGDLMSFLEDDVKVAIAAALIRARREMGKEILLEDLPMPLSDGGSELTDVSVRAMGGHSKSSFVWFITFEPKPPIEDPLDGSDDPGRSGEEGQATGQSATGESDSKRISVPRDAFTAMESELLYTKESLSASIDALETSNEELQATNEELVASNEELQSTNEELHSVNEELYSVNAENQRKIEALEEMTDDVDNLLASTDIGTIFLDSELRVRKFTRAASSYIKLLPSDIGRHLTDFATHIVCVDFYDKISRVITSGQSITEHVATRNSDRKVLVRILPYLSNGAVKGAIVNFIELDESDE